MNEKKGLFTSAKELNNSFKNLFKDSPSISFLFFCISIISIYYILSYSLTIMTGLAVLIVLITSLVVYFTTKNYGEASLSLVAGLLTIFTVQWTIALSIVFCDTWITFTTIALIFYSVRLAAKSEDIYVQAAQFLSENPDQTNNIQNELESIGKNHSGLLGPIERAEALRVLSFRKVPIDQMQKYLKAVDQISTITKVDYVQVSNFFGEFYRLTEITKPEQFKLSFDAIYDAIKQTPAHPKEFIEAFSQTRRLVLKEEMELIRLIYGIQEGLTKGETIDTIYKYLVENVPKDF